MDCERVEFGTSKRGEHTEERDKCSAGQAHIDELNVLAESVCGQTWLCL